MYFMSIYVIIGTGKFNFYTVKIGISGGRMNYIDIILIIVALIGFLIGWKLRGIFMIIVPAAFLLGIVAANLGYHNLSALLAKHISEESSRTVISYCAIFLIASSIIVFLGVFISHFFDFLSLAFLDRILGAAIMITVLIILVYLGLDHMRDKNMFNLNTGLQHSLFFPYIQKYADFIFKIPILKQFTIANHIIK